VATSKFVRIAQLTGNRLDRVCTRTGRRAAKAKIEKLRCKRLHFRAIYVMEICVSCARRLLTVNPTSRIL